MAGRSDGALLRALQEAGVQFVVVGGLAVNLAGFERYTKDVDVMVEASAEAFQAVRSALGSIGATRLDGSAIEDDLFDGEHVLTTTSEFGRLDVLPDGESPLTLAEMLARGTALEYDGAQVIVCSVADLARLKRIADRPQDRTDVDALEDLHGPLD